jgi:hypothetical protein
MARTRVAGGVGLGLAIVDAIAKRHGGTCTVRSTLHGSVFALVLPAAVASEAHGTGANGATGPAAATASSGAARQKFPEIA